jgi:cell division protein FtsA
VTNDIAVGLKTSTSAAESLKIQYGVARADLVDERTQIEVPIGGSDRKKQYSQKLLAEIIEPRMEEIFDEVKQQIIKNVSLDMIPAGVVLTGGTSLMGGCSELAEEILGLPVRRGTPLDLGGLKERVQSPVYATALGLIRYGSQNYRNEIVEEGLVGGVVDRIRAVFKKFFD